MSLETIEEIWDLKQSALNLLMIKIAHEFGVDVKNSRISPYQTDIVNGFDNGYEIFIDILQMVYEIVEIYCWDDEETIDERNYWLRETDFDPSMCVVLMDDRLKGIKNVSFIDLMMERIVDTCVEMYSIESGIVILWDDDYGYPDWTSILYSLYKVEKMLIEGD